MPTDNVNETETLDAMLDRHRAEERELQREIKQLVDATPKKKRKELQSRIIDMEYELRIKHERELRKLQGEDEEDDVSWITCTKTKDGTHAFLVLI